MKKLRILIAVCVVVCVMLATIAIAKSAPDQKSPVVRKIDAQVVLYTVYRGSYESVAQAIGQLYGLAGAKGIAPTGDLEFAYLNSPATVSGAHLLTEIRIPVGKEALKHTGKLGKMTDVKQLSATDAAVTTKPKGMEDPSDIYVSLYKWIYKNGYVTVDVPIEIFRSNTRGGNYADMTSEIMIPVMKVVDNK